LNFSMILFQFNNIISHKKVYQYTNTVFKDYVKDTLFNSAIPACFWVEKVRYECATQDATHSKNQVIDLY